MTLWTVTHQVPLSMRFSWQEYWSRVPFSLPGDLSEPGIEPTSLTAPALAGGFFTTSVPWEMHYIYQVSSFNSHKNLWGRYCYYLCFEVLRTEMRVSNMPHVLQVVRFGVLSSHCHGMEMEVRRIPTVWWDFPLAAEGMPTCWTYDMLRGEISLWEAGMWSSFVLRLQYCSVEPKD